MTPWDWTIVCLSWLGAFQLGCWAGRLAFWLVQTAICGLDAWQAERFEDEAQIDPAQPGGE